jgi:hypothetical protein
MASATTFHWKYGKLKGKLASSLANINSPLEVSQMQTSTQKQEIKSAHSVMGEILTMPISVLDPVEEETERSVESIDWDCALQCLAMVAVRCR